MNVRLHIERLVLDGLPITQRQGPQLQAAIQQELVRLLADSGSLAQFNTGGAVAAINGGTIQLTPAADVTGIGRQVATAVHGSLGGER